MDENKRNALLRMGWDIHGAVEDSYRQHPATRNEAAGWREKQRLLLADMAIHLLQTALAPGDIALDRLSDNPPLSRSPHSCCAAGPGFKASTCSGARLMVWAGKANAKPASSRPRMIDSSSASRISTLASQSDTVIYENTSMS